MAMIYYSSNSAVLTRRGNVTGMSYEALDSFMPTVLTHGKSSAAKLERSGSRRLVESTCVSEKHGNDVLREAAIVATPWPTCHQALGLPDGTLLGQHRATGSAVSTRY